MNTNKILSFVRLDFNIIKPFKFAFLVIIALALGMGLFMKSTFAVTVYFIMGAMIFSLYPFSLGDKYGLGVLYGTLPGDRKKIVIGRYLFFLALYTVFAVLSTLASFIIAVVLKTEFNFLNEVIKILVLFDLMAFLCSVQYPVYFKFGYSKAYILLILMVSAMTTVLIQLPKILNKSSLTDSISDLGNLAGDIASNPLILILIPIAGLALLSVSAVISYFLYKSRDI